MTRFRTHVLCFDVWEINFIYLPAVIQYRRMKLNNCYFVIQVLNLFIALLLSAFETNGDDGNTFDDEEGNNSILKRLTKKLTKTKKTRLFVATFKERYKLYEVQLLESNLTAQGIPLQRQQRRVSNNTNKNHQDGEK